MADVQTVVQDIVRHVPEVVGVVLIDSDGIPMAWAGDFDLSPYDLGAVLAASHTCYAALGDDLGQSEAQTIMVEYDNLKLVHYRMPRGSLVLLAEKFAPLGVIRMEAKRSIQILTSTMISTEKDRARLMRQLKFRGPRASTSSEESTNLISLLERKEMSGGANR